MTTPSFSNLSSFGDNTLTWVFTTFLVSFLNSLHLATSKILLGFSEGSKCLFCVPWPLGLTFVETYMVYQLVGLSLPDLVPKVVHFLHFFTRTFISNPQYSAPHLVLTELSATAL